MTVAEEYSLRGWKDEPFFLERAGNRYLRKITDLYIQRMENGVTYTVIDPNEDLFYIGTVEDRISEFNQYGDNAYVPRTVYHSRYGWLCTSCQPIRSEGQVFGLLCEENAANKFVTVWLGILDLKTGIMRCCNAGHEYPAVMRAGGQYELLIDKHGMMLAIFEDNAMTGYEIRLNPGDRFFVYTDGVTEAMNEKQQQYGTGRMLEELNSLKDSDQETVLRGVLGDIRNYAGSAEQFDDITMLGLTFQGE